MDEIWSLDILSIYVCSMLWVKGERVSNSEVVSNILQTFVSSLGERGFARFYMSFVDASQLHMSHSYYLSLNFRSVDLYHTYSFLNLDILIPLYT